LKCIGMGGVGGREWRAETFKRRIENGNRNA
jgi:hypothetical protein